MPRTTLTKTTAKGPFPTLPVTAEGLDATFTAADVGNKNQFLPSGDDLIIAWNTDGANPYTFTMTSAVDTGNRTGDIATYSLAAGDHGVFRVKTMGWVQADGYVYLEGSNAAVKFAIVALG